jgi:hypothetical protein
LSAPAAAGASSTAAGASSTAAGASSTAGWARDGEPGVAPAPAPAADHAGAGWAPTVLAGPAADVFGSTVATVPSSPPAAGAQVGGAAPVRPQGTAADVRGAVDRATGGGVAGRGAVPASGEVPGVPPDGWPDDGGQPAAPAATWTAAAATTDLARQLARLLHDEADLRGIAP